MSIPTTEDVSGFLEEVDEVSRLIEGLAKGTITPDYIDRKSELKEAKIKERDEAEKKKKLDAVKGRPVDQADSTK